MNSQSISVALCTYNGARYLKEQVDSILGQTRPPSEVIVCDDGSNDDSLEILSEFVERAPFLVTIIRNSHNLGFTKNFEKAIGLCKGDLIALADQDDIWYPNKLEVLSTILESDRNSGYACSDADLIDSSGKPLLGTRWRRASIRFLPKSKSPFMIQISTLIKQNVVCGSATMFRSCLKPLVLPVNNRWAHDYWIAMLATLTGNYGLGVEEPLMKYRLHATQAFGLHPRPWKLLSHLQSAPLDVWAKDAAMYCDLRKTIHERADLMAMCNKDDLWFLDQKIAHLTQRDLARTSGRRIRWKTVFAELNNGRYRQFSLSWKSALRDLVT